MTNDTSMHDKCHTAFLITSVFAEKYNFPHKRKYKYPFLIFGKC